MGIDRSWHQGPPTTIDNASVGDGQRLRRDLSNQVAHYQHVGTFDSLFANSVEYVDIGEQNRAWRLLCVAGCEDQKLADNDKKLPDGSTTSSTQLNSPC